MATPSPSVEGDFQHLVDIEKIYWHDLKRCTPITRDEEICLIKRARKGDEEAWQQLITANLRFVIRIAKHYSGNGLSLLELISEGNMGLLEAARRFDETRGCKFITYAVWWIRQHILKALSRCKRSVHPPANQLNDSKKMEQKTEELSQKLGRMPTLIEVAENTHLSVARVFRAQESKMKDTHLDTPIFEEEEKTAISQLISKGEMLEQDVDTPLLASALDFCLGTLSERERQIIRWYYGFDGQSPMTLEEIGSIFCLTRERIRQLRNRALEKLRQEHGELLMEFSHN